MTKRIYISGPMTGRHNNNYPAFYDAEEDLEDQGYVVLNPARNSECDSWREYMRLAIMQLAQADEMYMLPEWTASQGACLEYTIGEALGMTIKGAFS